MYEKTIIANERISQWSAAFVLIFKPNFIEPRFTFNYHFVYKKSSKSTMKLTIKTHSFMRNSNNKIFFFVNMKHDYWNVLVHSKDKHYLTFHVFEIEQLQFTRMLQKTKFFSFIFIELMNIALNFISKFHAKLSLLHLIDHHSSFNVAFYINDVFEAHTNYENQYNFLKNHLFFRILWVMMRVSLVKLKINMKKIKILNQIHRIKETLNIKQEFIDKIRKWFTSQTISKIKSFLKIIQSIRKWIQGFEKTVRFLQRFENNKIEWRWIESKKLSFQIFRKQCFIVLSMFEHDFSKSIEAYTNVSLYDEDLYIR